MNSICLTGRITNDLERKVTTSGISVCSFSLAVKRPRVKDKTDFINCVAYRQASDFLINYAQKGTLIEVTGALTSRKWEDKNGNKRTSFEVNVDTASILESKKANCNIEKFAEEFTEVDSDDDLPF